VRLTSIGARAMGASSSCDAHPKIDDDTKTTRTMPLGQLDHIDQS
jgi:hypothetical protein